MAYWHHRGWYKRAVLYWCGPTDFAGGNWYKCLLTFTIVETVLELAADKKYGIWVQTPSRCPQLAIWLATLVLQRPKGEAGPCCHHLDPKSTQAS